MRDRFVEGLNELLEIDHKAVEEAYMLPVKLDDHSPLRNHKCSVRVDCASYVTALDLIGLVIDNKPIIAVYENGIIQRFQ